MPGGNGGGCLPDSANLAGGGGGGATAVGAIRYLRSWWNWRCRCTKHILQVLMSSYAGGGGGGKRCAGSGSAGSGGAGGGGAGSKASCTAGTAGTTNTGGGAGSGGLQSPGSAGGTGIVVVRGPSAVTFTAGPCTNTTSTTPGGCKVATFTVSGTLTVS
jgi:hypothetical protein